MGAAIGSPFFFAGDPKGHAYHDLFEVTNITTSCVGYYIVSLEIDEIK